MTRAATPIECLILGGGAAGIALGCELKRRSCSFLILEQGDGVGESWRRMPTRLKLVSPWRASLLREGDAPRFPAHAAISRNEYQRYLQDLAGNHQLPVQTGVCVHSVRRAMDSGFIVQTSQGEFRSRHVVNATGYFAKPFLPEIAGARDTTIPQVHFANYGDPDQLRERLALNGGPVLIIGKRLSAGQAMVELVDAGLTVALAHRSPICFGPGPRAHWLFFRIFPEIERLKLWWQGDSARGFDVKMDGGRARDLLQSGSVKTFPGLRKFEGDTVVFENEARLRPAAVLYATGFLPALDHLRPLLPECTETSPMPALHRMESAIVPGLFFLGLDHQRNLQSRYLRGIRRDAIALAEILSERTTAGPPVAQHQFASAADSPSASVP